MTKRGLEEGGTTLPVERMVAALSGVTLALAMLGPAARAAMPQAAKEASASLDASLTCFSGQLNGPDAGRIAASTVLVVLRHADGHPESIGTGFVVAGSGSPENRHNSILTDAHVALDKPAGGHIEIIGSDSVKIGNATVAAIGSQYSEATPHNDLSVLRIADGDFFPGQMVRYDALPGLSFGPQYAGGHLSGQVATPAGLTGGNSGGPLVNMSGEVIGVAQAAIESGATVTVTRPKLTHPFKPGTHDVEAVPEQMAVPNRSYFTTVIDPVVVNALGNVGRTMKIAADLPETPALLIGVPKVECVVSNVVVKPVDTNSLDDFKPFEPGPVPETARFRGWDDPIRAATELKTLLAQAALELPEDQTLAVLSKTLSQQTDIRQMKLDDVPKKLVVLAASVNDVALEQRLVDASYNLRAYNQRHELGMEPTPRQQPQAGSKPIQPKP